MSENANDVEDFLPHKRNSTKSLVFKNSNTNTNAYMRIGVIDIPVLLNTKLNSQRWVKSWLTVFLLRMKEMLVLNMCKDMHLLYDHCLKTFWNINNSKTCKSWRRQTEAAPSLQMHQYTMSIYVINIWHRELENKWCYIYMWTCPVGTAALRLCYTSYRILPKRKFLDFQRSSIVTFGWSAWF